MHLINISALRYKEKAVIAHNFAKTLNLPQ